MSGGALILVGVALPFVLLAFLGVASLLGRRLPEGLTGRLTALASGGALLAFLLAAPAVWAAPGHRLVLRAATLFSVDHAAFRFDLVADPLALWFAALTAALSGVVASFSHRYLHKEPGYQRYFVLFATFTGGLLLIALAGSMEVLFTGWELIGLASALLVGFFHERAAPVRNALYVFGIYRLGDAAMLAAAVLVHHFVGTGSLDALLAGGGAVGALSAGAATLVGLLLLLAVAAKSAQLPLSGWLPRAMEGPTPSSGVFYGALSVHAGAYLMLRLQPLILHSPATAWLLGALGLATALHATLVGRVQTDIKSALSYASLTQVSLVLVEIACGLRWLPVLHMTGHACLRLLQFLRSPSLLEDVRAAEDAVGGHLAHTGLHLERGVPAPAQVWLYRHALERGGLDAWIERLVTVPFRRLLSACDRAERAWCGWLARRAEDEHG